jgi:hypothetical protein
MWPFYDVDGCQETLFSDCEGAVSDIGAGLYPLFGQQLCRLGADVQNEVVVLHLGGGFHRRLGVGAEGLGCDHIGGIGTAAQPKRELRVVFIKMWTGLPSAYLE